jgi:isopentenyl diphosphate isomerase/L-lactate dehydrogenase-like FMN-dependent dehydrogenase
MDAFKALALGAVAVCVGRAVMPGLAENGAEGVRKFLEDMTSELRWAMSMTGAKDSAHIDPSVIWDSRAISLPLSSNPY